MKKSHLALGKSKALLSPWSQFNKHMVYNNQIVYSNPSYIAVLLSLYMNANCLTPKPLDVIFTTPGIIFFNTQLTSLTRPRTAVEIIITVFVH